MKFVDARMMQGKRLINLEYNMCRWPIGDVPGILQRFCAEPVREGSYCEAHYRKSRARNGADHEYSMAKRATLETARLAEASAQPRKIVANV